MTLKEAQDALVAQVNAVGDCFDQYAYLIACAAKLPPMPPEYHTEDALVQGCQSKLWLRLVKEGDHLRITGDSDTMILKGILYLFDTLAAQVPPQELAAFDPGFLTATDLTVTFSSDRMNGIGSIAGRIRAQAAALA